ncbi:MAG TPA: adenylate/guanylate cyclase domain-containing protein, partial [Nevskiaceae bacterium]|nr:adenylate/guanylate cyclase domain-containing protein [Nevskiaceae bacterium]
MRVCAQCTTKNRESARYCDQCGTRFEGAPAPAETASYTPRHLAEQILNSRAAMVGERKQVTVLFADIKGSTRLAEAVGAEGWHEILNQFFALLAAAVHRYEGTVNQYTGDGIMALFGAPIAHEDHAQRAAMAALEMQREVRRYAARLMVERQIEFGMRVGLNTGEVVVGRIGDDLRMDYTAKGLTVNLAARMEQICEPGMINLSRYTAEQLRDEFLLRDLGEREVAGALHPIRVYELQEARPQARLAAADGTAAPMFGRASELEQLKLALAQVRAGEGRIVAISGEAGIGKSRLAREFLKACWQESVPVHHAAGVPYASAMPLAPVQVLLRSRLALAERATSDDVCARVASAFAPRSRRKSLVVPAITDFLGAGGGQERGAAVRSLMLERLARFLPRADTPQVLLIEDLHYADDATEDFLTRLCEQLAGSATLLLLTYRNEYASGWVAPYLDQRIELAPLPADQVDQLARAQLGAAPELAAVARGIVERAGGNPFFVEEAVAALADEGHLSGKPGDYRLARAIDEWPIPGSVQALVAGRVDRLPEQEKNLLQLAAVLGRVFDPALLAACAGETAERDLASLAAAGFVRARAGGGYEFCHALTQEVTYHAQLDAQRSGTHGLAAAALEQRHGDAYVPAEAALQIAHHWREAQAWAKAGYWSMRAAEYFSARDARATLQHYRQA